MLEVNQSRGDGDALAFQAPDQRLQLELLDRAGVGIREAEPMTTSCSSTRAGSSRVHMFSASRSRPTALGRRRTADCAAAR